MLLLLLLYIRTGGQDGDVGVEGRSYWVEVAIVCEVFEAGRVQCHITAQVSSGDASSQPTASLYVRSTFLTADIGKQASSHATAAEATAMPVGIRADTVNMSVGVHYSCPETCVILPLLLADVLSVAAWVNELILDT